MVRKYFKTLVFDWRLKHAKKKAQHDAALYGKKFLVLVFGGKPVVVSMQGIKTYTKAPFLKKFHRRKGREMRVIYCIP